MAGITQSEYNRRRRRKLKRRKAYSQVGLAGALAAMLFFIGYVVSANNNAP